MDNTQTSVRKFDVRLIEFDADEKIICEIRKHTFGLLIIYVTGALVAATILLAGTFLGQWIKNSTVNTLVSGQIVTIVAIVLTVVVIILTAVYAFVFRNNVSLLTTEKIAQILYKSLFNRKVSQLNISDVQDVTVVQSGIFARAFNYGTLVIETAGEQQNYTFTFATKPYECAKDIISAHESNAKQLGN